MVIDVLVNTHSFRVLTSNHPPTSIIIEANHVSSVIWTWECIWKNTCIAGDTCTKSDDFYMHSKSNLCPIFIIPFKSQFTMCDSTAQMEI